jgi:hypothetical protein
MNIDNYQGKQLDRQNFASALQKGLGRAFLHVKQYGLDNVSDLVLQACLHDQAWDPQCEGSRAKWLFSMFHNSKHFQEFYSAILGALETERDTWNLQQLFELAREMALIGNKRAQETIRGRALKNANRKSSDDDWVGAKEWMEIGGTEGMLELVRIYGQRLLSDPEDFVPKHEVFPEYKISVEHKEMLAAYADKEPTIKAYLKYIEKDKSSSRASSNLAIVSNVNITKEETIKRARERFRENVSLSSIIKRAKNKYGEFLIIYANFGKYATREELETIYSEFLKEKDDDIRLRLLWVFRRAPIPYLDESLFDLADGTNEKLRSASLNALAQITDPRVHELAKHKVLARQLLGPDNVALYLFVNNYTTEDANLITQALLTINPNQEDAHSLVSDIVDIAKRHNDAVLVDALIWGYGITPCSNCRLDVVVQLDKLNRFDGYILNECAFDAYEDIVALAKKRLGHVV